MKEVWVDVNGYNGKYKISNLGNVMSSYGRYNGKILFKSKNNCGYYRVLLVDNGVKKRHFIHKLVLNNFHPPSNETLQINHIDENKSNNSLCNLEYVTAKQNMNHGTSSMRRGAHHKKSVSQFTLNGELISSKGGCVEYEPFGFCGKMISACCLGSTKTYSGFIWKYNLKEDES